MKRLVLRTTLPALLAIGLFSGVVFFSFLPSLSRAVMDQKRLMIRELTDAPMCLNRLWIFISTCAMLATMGHRPMSPLCPEAA